ncbi:MAG: hypothetical protein PF517_11905 [Salinivirgaceae bacterium]|jgi:hypothetical protein|nr:hypothetical protein [Salinivirgaceae bacterium]
MKQVKLLLGIVFASILILSCSNNKSSKKSADAVDDIDIDNLEIVAGNVPMPSSYEIIQLLNNSGAGYIFDITNPPQNVENYITYKQKAINLGIYATDLTYTTTYQKRDETAMYLDNFVQLVEDLEITVLDSKFFESVQGNLDNRDSLIIIIKKAQHDTHVFLNESGKTEIALYALTGSWIEGMYLVGAAVKFAENKEPLYEVILKHKKSLVDLISIMEKEKDNENFKDIYSSLGDILSLLKKMEKNNNDYKTAEQLKDKITDLRNSLV